MLFKKEWSYVTGAVLLAMLSIMLFLVAKTAWGVTGPFSLWGGKFLEFAGINADSWAMYNGKLAKYTFWKSVPSVTNIGIILGALMSTLLAASFKLKKINSMRQVVAALLGGLFMGVGARFAMGCNIGAFFSAIPAFSLHAWIFMIFFFSGAIVGSFMLKKWFM